MNKVSIFMCGLALPAFAYADSELPELYPMPEVVAPLDVNSVKMDDSESFEEVQLDIPIAEGPFAPNWESIEANYPGTPDWLREAKFGIWVHFGPQSAGESGDWYARHLYTDIRRKWDIRMCFATGIRQLSIRNTLQSFIIRPVLDS